MRLVARRAPIIDWVNNVLLVPGSAIQLVVAARAGILLALDLWTRIARALVSFFKLWAAFSQAGDPWAYVLLAALGTALALLPPGTRSEPSRLRVGSVLISGTTDTESSAVKEPVYRAFPPKSVDKSAKIMTQYWNWASLAVITRRTVINVCACQFSAAVELAVTIDQHATRFRTSRLD
jgi:hypothetical protein